MTMDYLIMTENSEFTKHADFVYGYLTLKGVLVLSA